MSLFRHPHLTRGVIRTPHGAFTITRGIVDVPDEVGHALGWLPVDDEDEGARDARKFLSRQSTAPDAPSAGEAY